MSIDDLWYKHAVIYCMEVEKYVDANGDGVGDFEGLNRKLDYLHSLGVTCIWLQPFYGSPNRDNGYDVSDYFAVDPRYGTLGDCADFMSRARALGMRIIVDLVVNHTSVEHPWFQSARNGPESPHYDWYIWADERPADHEEGIVFPGVQKSTWTWDRKARQYYFHRFYEWQPDLNTHNPAVRNEIYKIMGFWLDLGVSGFRMDAVPFLIERKGADVEHVKDFELLHKMRDFLQWRRSDAILLAEANVLPEESNDYFGEQGDRLQMMLNFPVNQRLFYAFATEDCDPLIEALNATAEIPSDAQWVQFLRSHDELDLGRLSDEQRERVFKELAADEQMQLYRRGIRRRLAPILSNDRRRLELAFSLLFALPGTPMLQYGDEIGIGDDLSLPEREAVRTPMQWANTINGGFSRAEKPVRKTIDDPEYGYEKVNVADQQRDMKSLWNWLSRLIHTRQECPEIGWGKYTVLPTDAPSVLALRYDWRGLAMITLHNFSSKQAKVRFVVEGREDDPLVNIFEKEQYEPRKGEHDFVLDGYEYKWLRVGAYDTTLDQKPF